MAWAVQEGFEPVKIDSKFGNWVTNQAGKLDGKTNFKSQFKIVDAQGKDLSFEKQDGEFAFDEVPEGSVIQWEVETYADDEKPASDRFNIEITSMDNSYTTRLINLALDDLTDEDFLAVIRGDTKPIMDWLEKNPDVVNPQLAFVTMYSKTLETDDNGKASGSIPIPKDWPLSAYAINFHYGYSDLAEQDTANKTERLWKEDIGPFLVEVVITATLTAITGGMYLGLRAGWAAAQATMKTYKAYRWAKRTKLIAELVGVAMAAKQLARDGFGVVGVNKYGSSFPILGYNHSYSFNNDYLAAIEQESGKIDLSKFDENKIEALIQQNLGRNLAIGIVFMGLFLFGIRGKKN